MTEEMKNVAYIDSNGQHAVATEQLSSWTILNDNFTMFSYKKKLINDMSKEAGAAFLCLPSKAELKSKCEFADSEEEALMSTLSALSKEICMTEHHLEELRRLSSVLSDELR